MVATFPKSPQTSAPQNTPGILGATATTLRPPGGLCPQRSTAPGSGGLMAPSAQEGSLPKPGHPRVLCAPPGPHAAWLFPNPEGLPGAGADASASREEGSRGTDGRSRWCPGAWHRSTPLPRSQPCGGTPACGESQGQIWANRRGLRPVQSSGSAVQPRSLAQQLVAQRVPRGTHGGGKGQGQTGGRCKVWGEKQLGHSARALGGKGDRRGPGSRPPLCHHATG